MRRLKYGTMFTIAAVALLLAATAGAQEKAAGTAKQAPAKAKSETAADEIAVLETTRGRMVLEFWEKDAPMTVANFKKLARQGYFDGTGFHRIIKNFMIQGGDPKSKNPKAPDLGTGDPGYKIKDEFNAHKHVKGVISMANSGSPNSAGSQFFLMHGTSEHLDGKYTAFGRLVHGLDVLDAIASSPVGPNPMMRGEQSKPLEWTTLRSVKILGRAEYAKMQAGEKAASEKAATERAAKAAEAQKAAEKAVAAQQEAAKAATEAATKAMEKEAAEKAKEADKAKSGEGGGSN